MPQARVGRLFAAEGAELDQMCAGTAGNGASGFGGGLAAADAVRGGRTTAPLLHNDRAVDHRPDCTATGVRRTNAGVRRTSGVDGGRVSAEAHRLLRRRIGCEPRQRCEPAGGSERARRGFGRQARCRVKRPARAVRRRWCGTARAGNWQQPPPTIWSTPGLFSSASCAAAHHRRDHGHLQQAATRSRWLFGAAMRPIRAMPCTT